MEVEVEIETKRTNGKWSYKVKNLDLSQVNVACKSGYIYSTEDEAVTAACKNIQKFLREEAEDFGVHRCTISENGWAGSKIV